MSDAILIVVWVLAITALVVFVVWSTSFFKKNYSGGEVVWTSAGEMLEPYPNGPHKFSVGDVVWVNLDADRNKEKAMIAEIVDHDVFNIYTVRFYDTSIRYSGFIMESQLKRCNK